MSSKYRFFIEVKVPNGPEGWKELVNNEMRQAIEKLKPQWKNWEAKFASDTEA